MRVKTKLSKKNKYDLWVLTSDNEVRLSSKNLTYQAASLVLGFIEQEVLEGVRPMIAPVELRESIQMSMAD